MPNQRKEDIIQVAAFLGGAIQGLIWAQAPVEKFFSAVGHMMPLGQAGPPVGKLLPFDRIGSHDTWIKSEASSHGTIR